MKGMATCKVCGRDFALMAEEHYVVSDPKKTGVMAALINDNKAHEYDAFDCPHCGCQYVAQERKPLAVAFEEYPSSDNGDDKEDEHFDYQSYLEHLKHSDYHHGCANCKYELLDENKEPCVNCIHCSDANNNTCKYEPKEDK